MVIGVIIIIKQLHVTIIKCLHLVINCLYYGFEYAYDGFNFGLEYCNIKSVIWLSIDMESIWICIENWFCYDKENESNINRAIYSCMLVNRK